MDANLSEVIKLRCDPEFRAAVFAAAEARGLPVSAFVRSQLAAAVIPQADQSERYPGIATTARELSVKRRG